MDYRTLANAAAPGQSPLGSGIVDPVGYNRWLNLSNIQQQALQKAMPLADMDAQRQQQAMTEYMAGAPGRMNQTTLANMTAEAGVEGFPRAQARKKLDEELADAKRSAEMADFTKDIGQFGDAYINAQTPEEQEKIRKAVAGQKLRNGYVMGTDPAKDDLFLYGAGKSRASAPSVQVKRDVEDKKGENRLTLENRKALNSKELVELRGRISSHLQSQRDAATNARSNNKPKSLSAAVAERLDQRYGNDTAGWLEAYNMLEQAGKMFGADTQTAILKSLNIEAPQQTEPRSLPEPKQTPQQVPFSGKGVVDLDLEDFNKIKTNESVWQYGKDKKSKVVKKQFNSQTGEYRLILEDGTTIQNKFKGR
jgi:hypothetical protein